MSSKERKDFIRKVKSESLRISKDSTAAREVLISAGIYTSKGNLKKNYKH